MHPNTALVFDKAKLAKPIHKEANAGPGGADHLGQHLLGDFWKHRLWPGLLAEIRQQQQGARQALFARIEELVDQILFDPGVARQYVIPIRRDRDSRSLGILESAAS